MGLGLFELRKVKGIPWVAAMFIKGILCPCGKTSKGIRSRIVKAEIVCKLPPHDQFFQKSVFRLCSRWQIFHPQGDSLRCDLTELR